MGRFDALTQLDKKIEKTPTPPGVSHHVSEQPRQDNQIASTEAYQHGSVEAQKHTSTLAPPLSVLKQDTPTNHLPLIPIPKKPKKLGSWLYEDTQRSLAVIAAKRGCKQWEVLQEAVDLYLRTTKQ